MLGDQLLQEVLVEPVQVLDRVEHREARPHAEKQRDLAEAGLQVDDDRSAAWSAAPARRRSSPRRSSCRRRPWRRETRASRTAAWRRRSPPRGAPRSAAPRRGTIPPSRAPPAIPPPRSRERTRWRRRASPGGSDRARRPPRSRRSPGSRCSRAAARSPPCPTRRRTRMSTTTRSGPLPSADAPFDDADRHAAGAQQARDLPLELVVVADDLRRELGHGYCTSRMAFGIDAGRRAGASCRDAADRSDAAVDVVCPCIRSTKKPIQLASFSEALRPPALPSS